MWAALRMEESCDSRRGFLGRLLPGEYRCRLQGWGEAGTRRYSGVEPRRKEGKREGGREGGEKKQRKTRSEIRTFPQKLCEGNITYTLIQFSYYAY